MARRLVVVLVVSSSWLLSCTASHEGSDACDVANEMRDAALSRALLDAPACEADSDCVVFSTFVHCEGIVTLTDCGVVAHREVARRYEAMGVNDAVCRAVVGSDLGCWQGPACIASGPPFCQAGQCVRLPL